MSNPLIEEADILLKNDEFEKAFRLLLPHKDKEDDEILWRLAQAMHDIAYFHPNQSSETVKRMNEEGLQLITKALEINEKNPEVHKVMAALIDAHYKNVSIKARVEQSVVAKKHTMRALELNPRDPHIYYSLGQFHYALAELPWAIKKVTQLVFSTPLESTYKEALSYFLKLLDMEEAKTYKSYSMGFLMAAKCYIKLNKTSEAIEHLNRVFDFPKKTRIEEEAREEAIKLLDNL